MASYIAIFLSLISIILFLVILLRLKKIFSTDQIIEKSRSQMDKMIKDLNNNTERDIQLLEQSSKRMRTLLHEADVKMDAFRQATDRLREMINESEKIRSQSSGQQIYVENKRISDIKPVGKIKSSSVKIESDDVFSIKKEQGELFDETSVNPTILKDETKITSEGVAFKEVPLIITKIIDNPQIQDDNKKNLTSQVQKLFGQGMQVEDIARQLSVSVTEVQLIIDLDL